MLERGCRGIRWRLRSRLRTERHLTITFNWTGTSPTKGEFLGNRRRAANHLTRIREDKREMLICLYVLGSKV